MAATNDKPIITVVIPTWNRKDLVADCLTSLRAQTCRLFEALVVDDASTDDTAGLVAARFPEARVLRLETNQGFCGASNAGITAAETPWVFLLNNDVTLEPDFLARMLEAAHNTSAQMLTPLILWKDQPDTIYSAGDAQHANGRPEAIGYRQRRDAFPLPEHVFGVSGAACLIHRDVFATVGLFDPVIVDYFSDSDLNLRARLAGFEVRLVPEAIAYHVGSASLAGNTLKRTRQCCINHAVLVIKDLPGAILRRHALEIVAECMHQARCVFTRARTEGGALFALRVLGQTWRQLLARVPKALAARRGVQARRTVSAADLERLLS